MQPEREDRDGTASETQGNYSFSSKKMSRVSLNCLLCLSTLLLHYVKKQLTLDLYRKEEENCRTAHIPRVDVL